MIRRIIAGILIGIALGGPTLANLIGIELSAQGIPFTNASNTGFLGTEHLGRSVSAAVLVGGQALVLTALVVGTLTTAFGGLIGCLGALRPKLGFIIEATADATILVPAVILLLLAAVLYPNGGLPLLIGVSVFVGTPYAARVIAAAAYPVARSGYVQAAQGTGATTASIILRDIIPNISGVLRSVWGLRTIEALYVLATASFLGVGTSLGEFAWSAMVRDNASGISLNPWSVLAPAGALAVTSIAIVALLNEPHKKAKGEPSSWSTLILR